MTSNTCLLYTHTSFPRQVPLTSVGNMAPFLSEQQKHFVLGAAAALLLQAGHEIKKKEEEKAKVVGSSVVFRLWGFLRVKFILALCIFFASHFNFCMRQPLYSINSLYFVTVLKALKWHDPSKHIWPRFKMVEHARA